MEQAAAVAASFLRSFDQVREMIGWPKWMSWIRSPPSFAFVTRAVPKDNRVYGMPYRINPAAIRRLRSGIAISSSIGPSADSGCLMSFLASFSSHTNSGPPVQRNFGRVGKSRCFDYKMQASL